MPNADDMADLERLAAAGANHATTNARLVEFGIRLRRRRRRGKPSAEAAQSG